jgi:shikimate kinase
VVVVVYLIGPSHVGKTSLAKAAAGHDHRYKHVEIDLEVCPHERANWTKVKAVFDRYEITPCSQTVILDIGAGTQQLPDLVSHLAHRSAGHVVLLMLPWETLDMRHYHPRGAELKKKEYTDRRELYKLADHELSVDDELSDDGKSTCEVLPEFLSVLDCLSACS